MSEKSVWQGLGNLVGGWGKSSAKPLATSTRRCEAGHPMAMDWVKCPYCEAARNAGEKTRVNEVDPPPDSSSGMPMPPPRHGAGATRINTTLEPAAGFAGLGASSERDAPRPNRATRIDPVAADGGGAPQSQSQSRYQAASHSAGSDPPGRGFTRVLDPSESSTPQAQRHGGGGRRLTGIVVTFTWSPLGQLFEVHEGRNFGGSGTVSAEGQRDADILVLDDTTMSSAHFLILCQGGKYSIKDCNSTNGTYVNGELIDALGIELADSAHIQAGATLLIFKKVLPPSAAPMPSVKVETLRPGRPIPSDDIGEDPLV